MAKDKKTTSGPRAEEPPRSEPRSAPEPGGPEPRAPESSAAESSTAESSTAESSTVGPSAPEPGEPRASREYQVVDAPFYDGVQLHEIGARVSWQGPPGKSLHPIDSVRRKSVTEAPIFPDALAGRGDKTKVDRATAALAGPFTVVQ